MAENEYLPSAADDPRSRIEDADSDDADNDSDALRNYQTFDSDAKEHYSWEEASKPFKIVKSLVQKGAQKMMLLLVIELDVTRNSWTKDSNYVQTCDLQDFHGPCIYGQALFCSITKAFVQCFPLFAIFCTVIVTMKQMHFKRVYYQTLKRHGLLVYESFNFHRDPDYLIMVFTYLMALAHFAQLFSRIFYYHVFSKINDEASLKEIIHNLTASEIPEIETTKSVLPFYILPGFVWWGLFISTYDSSKLSPPVMKLLSKEPYRMKLHFRKSSIMYEHIAAYVLLNTVMPSKAKDTETFYKAWVKESARISRKYYKLASSGHTAEADALTNGQVLSTRRMLNVWWPSRILFSARLDDVDSLDYRIYFDILTIVCGIICAIDFFFVSLNFYDAYLRVVSKHPYAIARFVVYSLFFLWMVHAMVALTIQTRMLRVCCDDVHHVDDWCWHLFKGEKGKDEAEGVAEKEKSHVLAFSQRQEGEEAEKGRRGRSEEEKEEIFLEEVEEGISNTRSSWRLVPSQLRMLGRNAAH